MTPTPPRLPAYRLPLAALLTGASIMIIEIVGARIIAPAFGSSVYVWTAVIGVILAALAAGYWYGGNLADRVASRPVLSSLLAIAATVLLVTFQFTRDILATTAALGGGDVRLQALIAALLLFAPVNILMGMASPFFTKLTVTSLEDTGRSVGRIEAAGTIGSILGTFLTGYVLLSLVGSRALGLSVVIILVISSLVVAVRPYVWLRLAVAALAVLSLAFGSENLSVGSVKTLYDGDSAYSRYRVVEAPHELGQVRYLLTDNRGAQSGIIVGQPDEPAFDYVRRMLEIVSAYPQPDGPRRVLVIGGGAYTLPRMIAERYPQTRIDVVEIDPKLDELARAYFGFRDDPRINIIHEDGRTFINRDHGGRYDLVLVDAYTALSPPFQLATVEAARRLADLTTPDGLVVANIISATSGSRAAFIRAEYATYGQAFSQVSVVTTRTDLPATTRQNVLLLAARTAPPVKRAAEAMAYPLLPAPEPAPVLTDDFAPVDAMTAASR